MEYQIQAHKIYKALTRPALCFGLPLPVLFCVCSPLFLLGSYLSLLFWVLIVPVIYLMGLLTKKDEHIYQLLYLRWQCRGNSKANHFFGSNAILAMQYRPVKMFELKSRRL